ncbi:MAG: SCO family protein [Chromatiales bacterium]|jgi:protein SCO1/2
MRRRPSRTLAFKVVVVLLAALMFYMGYYLGNVYQRDELEGLSATVLSTPQPVEPFDLVDHRGKPFTRESLEGQWDLVFFGFTHCPDVCPITMTLLARAYNRLAERPELQEHTRAVFVSVDPARDTPEKLKEFVEYFNPEFVGVTGSAEEIDKIASQFHIYYQVHQPADDSGDYAVDHSAAVLLIDPKGRLAAIFSSISDPKVLAGDLIRIADVLGS